MLRATRILSIPSINFKDAFVHLAAQVRLMVLGIVLARFFEIKKSNAERICVHLRLFAVNSVLLMLVLNHYQYFFNRRCTQINADVVMQEVIIMENWNPCI